MTRSHADDIEAIAAAYIARADAGTLTEDGRRDRDVWLASDARHMTAHLRMLAAWDIADMLAPGTVQESPQTASASASPSPSTSLLSGKPRTLVPWLTGAGMAAVLAIVITMAPGNSRYRAEFGKQAAVDLPDGSRAELNSEAEVSSRFDRHTRTLELLKGEAFFRVKHNPAVPFTVTAGSYRVIAVGTAFSMRRYAEKLVVTVEQGTVRIEQLQGAGAKLAHAGTVSDADTRGVTIATVGNERVRQALAWRDGLLSFNQRTLSEISAEFNRYNKRKFYVAGTVAERRMGGVFRSTETEAFVRLLLATDPRLATRTLPDGTIQVFEKNNVNT
jgi:transmembrane sensor